MNGYTVFGLLQAHDRNGALLGIVQVTHWPVTVGRAMGSGLVLDDPHVAPEHLRIERTVDGVVTVHVLDTRNGITHKRRTWHRGESFQWPAGDELHLGRLKLSLRLADEPVAPEQPLPLFPWRTTGWTVALAVAVLALMACAAWLQTSEPGKLGQALPTLMAGAAGSIAVWAGLWALVTRLFTGRLWFWRHVRIACATLLASQAVETLAHVAAFAFSWESLARFDVLITTAAAAVGVFLHLAVIAPQRKRGTAAIVAGITVLGIAVLLSSSWLQSRRLTNQLYMAAIFPPSWRVAPAVPVTQFLDEAQSIRARLDKRLKDKDEEEAPVEADDD